MLLLGAVHTVLLYLHVCAGVVPANGEVNINVEYSPTEFCTAVMELKVRSPKINSSGLIVMFLLLLAGDLPVQFNFQDMYLLWNMHTWISPVSVN